MKKDQGVKYIKQLSIKTGVQQLNKVRGSGREKREKSERGERGRERGKLFPKMDTYSA
jgi:hypothetical protein